MRENAVYSSIKAGISGMTWSMASYYGQFNIRVNSLCPGGVFNDKSDLKSKQKFFEKLSKEKSYKKNVYILKTFLTLQFF